MKMTPFNQWCYDHADEMLMGVASCKGGGCCACLRRLEIEFHIRAAGDGYNRKSHRASITTMIMLAGAYWKWLKSEHPNKSSKELIGTIHDLRLKMMGKRKLTHDRTTT